MIRYLLRLSNAVGIGLVVLNSDFFLCAAEKNAVKETFSQLQIFVETPIPKEIVNESEARKIAQEAAVVAGQNQLATYILAKKGKSGKTLSVVQTASTELKNEIRDYVRKTKTIDLKFTSNLCRLTLRLSKTQLRSLLKKN